ncbi:MAG: hypothetical protein GC154_17920 [bacterium]|nr:hypothetical protein [bacterium]
MGRYSLNEKRLTGSIVSRFTLTLVLCLCLFTQGGPFVTAQGLSGADYLTLSHEGKYREALDEIQRQIDSRPELAETRAYRYIVWLADRADILYRIGEVDAAISDLEVVTQEFFEPYFMLKLAQMYRDRGRMDDYKSALDRAMFNQREYKFYHTREENLIALGRIAELRGENPKQLLSTLYTSVMENRPNFIGGFIAAGDLAMRYDSYDLAEKYYNQALELDENDPDALAGLAECYWKADDHRLGEVMKRLDEADPDNMRAWIIQIEKALDIGAVDDAMEIIDRALKVNPNQLRVLSLKAAACFLDDDLGAMRAVQDKVLELNPHCAEVFHVPGRIASRHYRFSEGAAMQRRALEIDPEDEDARAQYALDLLRLGQDEPGKEQLEQAFKEDPYNVQSYNLLQMLDSIDGFDQIARGPFILQIPKKEAPILSDEIFALLDEEFEQYQKRYDIQLQTPIHVQVFDNHDDFMVRSVGLPGNVGFLGICFGHLVTMDSPSAREPYSMNWPSVLWHEFVHVITLQKTNNRMPRWLSEGISVYEETRRSPAWGQKLDLRYQSLIQKEDLPGLEDLESYFVQPKTGMHIMLGYLFASEFVRFYVDSYGMDALNKSLDQIGGGADTVEALTAASGASLEEVDDAFAEALRVRLAPYDNLPVIEEEKGLVETVLDAVKPEEPEMKLWIDEDSPFTNALREGLKYFNDENWAEAEKELRRAHELFPDYTGENAPLKVLIRLYGKTGEVEKLKDALIQETEHDSTDFKARVQLLTYYESEGDWQGAASAASLALEIDPFNLSVRKRLYKANRELGRYENAIQDAARLIALDPPHRLDYQLERIDLERAAGRTEAAHREVIRLLEEFPHHRQAQQTLLAILAEREGEPE